MQQEHAHSKKRYQFLAAMALLTALVLLVVGALIVYAAANDVSVTDGTFADWDDEYLLLDEGGMDDWTSPKRGDLTRLGVATDLNSNDPPTKLCYLFQIDEPSSGGDCGGAQGMAVSMQFDTNNPPNAWLDYELRVALNRDCTVDSVNLYTCNNRNCGKTTLSKTYTTSDWRAGDISPAFSSDPDNDYAIEVCIPLSDIGLDGVNDKIATRFVSHETKTANDTQDYIPHNMNVWVTYDTETGTAQKTTPTSITLLSLSVRSAATSLVPMVFALAFTALGLVALGVLVYRKAR